MKDGVICIAGCGRTDCPYYPTNEDVGVPAVCLRDTSVCKEQEGEDGH